MSVMGEMQLSSPGHKEVGLRQLKCVGPCADCLLCRGKSEKLLQKAEAELWLIRGKVEDAQAKLQQIRGSIWAVKGNAVASGQDSGS